MSLFVPLKRAALLVPSGPSVDPDRKHLFILLTDPCADEEGVQAVLMVSLSSVKPQIPYDPSCVLKAGDHPFVKRASFVDYGKARIEAVDKLLRGVKEGKLVPQPPVATEVFARICEGLVKSPRTAAKLLRFFRAACDRRAQTG